MTSDVPEYINVEDFIASTDIVEELDPSNPYYFTTDRRFGKLGQTRSGQIFLKNPNNGEWIGNYSIEQLRYATRKPPSVISSRRSSGRILHSNSGNIGLLNPPQQVNQCPTYSQQLPSYNQQERQGESSAINVSVTLSPPPSIPDFNHIKQQIGHLIPDLENLQSVCRDITAWEEMAHPSQGAISKLQAAEHSLCTMQAEHQAVISQKDYVIAALRSDIQRSRQELATFRSQQEKQLEAQKNDLLNQFRQQQEYDRLGSMMLNAEEFETEMNFEISTGPTQILPNLSPIDISFPSQSFKENNPIKRKSSSVSAQSSAKQPSRGDIVSICSMSPSTLMYLTKDGSIQQTSFKWKEKESQHQSNRTFSTPSTSLGHGLAPPMLQLEFSSISQLYPIDTVLSPKISSSSSPAVNATISSINPVSIAQSLRNSTTYIADEHSSTIISYRIHSDSHNVGPELGCFQIVAGGGTMDTFGSDPYQLEIFPRDIKFQQLLTVEASQVDNKILCLSKNFIMVFEPSAPTSSSLFSSSQYPISSLWKLPGTYSISSNPAAELNWAGFWNRRIIAATNYGVVEVVPFTHNFNVGDAFFNTLCGRDSPHDNGNQDGPRFHARFTSIFQCLALPQSSSYSSLSDIILFICDEGNQSIRMLNMVTEQVSTVCKDSISFPTSIAFLGDHLMYSSYDGQNSLHIKNQLPHEQRSSGLKMVYKFKSKALDPVIRTIHENIFLERRRLQEYVDHQEPQRTENNALRTEVHRLSRELASTTAQRDQLEQQMQFGRMESIHERRYHHKDIHIPPSHPESGSSKTNSSDVF